MSLRCTQALFYLISVTVGLVNVTPHFRGFSEEVLGLALDSVALSTASCEDTAILMPSLPGDSTWSSNRLLEYL
jgi:hypothetical protein